MLKKYVYLFYFTCGGFNLKQFHLEIASKFKK